MGETNIVFQLKLNLFYHSAKCDKPDQSSDEQNVAAILGRSGTKIVAYAKFYSCTKKI